MNDNEIIKFTNNIDMDDIERIDFDNVDYEQINSLGSKTLKEFADVCDKFRVANSGNNDIDEIEYLKLIDNLDIDKYFKEYDKELQKLKDQMTKKNKIGVPSNPLLLALNKLNDLFSKLLPKSKVEIDSFSDVEEKYMANIDELVIKTQQCLNVLIKEANENKVIKQILTMLNEKLQKTIDYASADLNDYKNRVIVPLEEKVRTKDEEDAYQMALTISSVVNSKINILKESLAINKETLRKRDIIILNNIPIAGIYNQFIYTIASNLKMNARTAIDIKIQQERIETQRLLSDKINQSLVNQSENLNNNIKESSKLMMEGTIKADTYKKFVSCANEATKLLLDAKEKMQTNTQLKQEIVEDTIKALDNSNLQIRNFAFDSVADNSTLNLESGKGLVKK